MENIVIEYLTDGRVSFIVDPNVDCGSTAGGNQRIASTGGNMLVGGPNFESFTVGINAYRKVRKQHNARKRKTAK